MSGFLGSMVGNFLSSHGPQMEQALPGILHELLSGQATGGGGLHGLLSQLEQAGLGQQAQSWVSNGAQNQSVPPDQLAQALPQDKVEQWAQQAGTTPDKLMGVLSQVLPHAVDQATPNGEVPQNTGQVNIGSVIGKLLGQH